MLKRVVARSVLLVVAVLANSSVIFFNDNVNGSVAAKFNISHSRADSPLVLNSFRF